MDLSLAGYHRHAIGLGFVVMIQKNPCPYFEYQRWSRFLKMARWRLQSLVNRFNAVLRHDAKSGQFSAFSTVMEQRTPKEKSYELEED
ncbi:hypothetical protein OUZ56_014434 [Daphnia magna]|uniref:Uncharacterized protein n=1 Tax=Daphnia magna TaxID=35525 RepID=A0ABR0AJQ7_9CRUS|nr:hypothetical protein OUZ56_014434 [Daphnia magna]